MNKVMPSCAQLGFYPFKGGNYLGGGLGIRVGRFPEVLPIGEFHRPSEGDLSFHWL